MAHEKYAKDNEEGNRYEEMVRAVASNFEGEKDQTKVVHILSSENARKTYDLLRKNEISDSAIKRIMKHSLDNFPAGKGLTPGSYTLGMAEELAQSEKYAEIIDEMHGQGIISERQYNEVKREIGNYSKEHVRKLRGGLEKIAASVFGIIGIGLILASRLNFTGRVIGGASADISWTVAGALLIVLSLGLFFRSFKK